MSDLYVVYWKKIGGLSDIKIEQIEDIERAKNFVKNYAELGYDVLIVEKYSTPNRKTFRYRLVKVGFYRYLKFFTHSIYKWAFLVVIILYLYYLILYKP